MASVDLATTNFFGVLNAAKESRDFSAFDALYLERCAYCVELREELRQLLAGGSTADGGDWIILQQSSSELASGTKANANVFAFRTALKLTTGAGADEEVAATPIHWFQLGLLGGEEWIVEDMGGSVLEQ